MFLRDLRSQWEKLESCQKASSENTACDGPDSV